MLSPEILFPLLETNLKRINSLRVDDPNEANTRLQVVDEILGLLGWSKSEFSPEESTGIGNYTDYLIRVNGNPHLVIEAKKLGKVFTLPKTLNRKEYLAKYLINACGIELKEAMTQAAQYCNERGAPYAVVTNGEQWIIFRGLASTQKGWIDFKTTIFYSSEMLKQNFSAFWNLLSKERVLEGALSEKLGYEVTKVPNFAKRPNTETDNPTIPSKVSSKNVDVLFDYYFDDIVTRDNGNMLRECYVEEKEIKEFSKELRSLLKDRLLSLGEEIESEEITETNFLSAIESAIESPLPDQRAKVVLLVGHVGAGKSTFLRRYFGNLEQQGYAKFIFDVLSEGNPSGKVRDNETEIISKFILENVSDYYYKKKDFGQQYDPYNHDTLHTIFGSLIRKIKEGGKRELYKKDNSLFEKDVAERLETEAKNCEQLLPLYLKYVYKRKKPNKPFCLIFDNVDRAPDQYQEFIYNFAHSLAKNISGIIIISMRETTYYRAKQKGFLDTRASDKVFQLNAPNIKTVISKRLKYLTYQINETKPATKTVKSYLPKIQPIAEHLKSILLLEDNTARELITSISNRSVRRAFRLLRSYASSPFAWENADNMKAGQRVLKALMLSKQLKYNSVDSPIINLFTVPSHSLISHFTLLKILAFLYWKYQKNSSFRESPKIADLLVALESVRIPRTQAKEALHKLINEELIECDNWYKSEQIESNLFDSGNLELSEDFHIRITSAGYYYLNVLANEKLYLGLCSQDTIWFSNESYEKYLEEFNTFIEIAKDEPGIDFIVNTKCLDIWLNYLGEERYNEEKILGDGIDKSWWNLAFNSIESIAPETKNVKDDKKTNKKRKSKKENIPTLWKE